MARPSEGFSSRQAIALTGVTRRQLAYWRETGLAEPSHRTPGGHARYSFPDLIALRTAKKLVDAGIPLQRIRASIGSLARFLPAATRPLSELCIVATGDVILVLHAGGAFEALTGQEWILPVAELARSVERLAGPASGSTPVQAELFPDAASGAVA